jgi:hypothetical protein
VLNRRVAVHRVRGSVISSGLPPGGVFKSPKEGVALLIVTGTNFGERDSAGLVCGVSGKTINPAQMRDLCAG